MTHLVRNTSSPPKSNLSWHFASELWLSSNRRRGLSICRVLRISRGLSICCVHHIPTNSIMGNEENISIIMPRSEPHKSKQSQELKDVWADFTKQARSVAPRGKRIIHETQAYQMYCDLPPDRKSLDSTVSDMLRTNTSQLSDASHIATPLRVRNGRNSDRLAFILARQNRYHQQEQLLGGPHNVFRDKCPTFVVSTSETETEDEIENQTEISSEIVGSVSGLMAGSQGRVGHGCSTPLSKANFTLAPLRKLDVSAVIKLDPKGSKDVFVNFPVSLVSEGRTVDDLTKVMVDVQDPVSSDEQKEKFTITQDEQLSKRDGTYVVSHGIQSEPVDSGIPNGTFTIESSAINSNREVGPVSGVDSQPTVSKDLMEFNGRKTTIEQREERVNISRKKNISSFVEDMNIDVPSPGRALFNARPVKKIRMLSKTPIREKQGRQTTVDDSMEVSIAMSEITPQTSVNVGDESMVDPQSDPRHVTILQTPTRAPGPKRMIHRSPAANKMTREEMDLKTSEPEKKALLALNPLRSENTVPMLVTARSNDRKSTLIKRSVDRLSRPRLHADQRCKRNEDLEHSVNVSKKKVSPSRTLIQRLPPDNDTSTIQFKEEDIQKATLCTPRTFSFGFARPTVSSIKKSTSNYISKTAILNASGDNSFEEMEVTGAITPFQPIDPSRMVVPNPEKSGTVQRLQQTRLHKTGVAQKATLFMDDESSLRRREEMKFKRVMDRKYPTVRNEASESIVKINDSDLPSAIIDKESMSCYPLPQHSQINDTVHREISSIQLPDKTKNIIIDYEQEDEELSSFTKKMSMNDALHTSIDVTVVSDSRGNCSTNNLVHQPNKLLSDSVCTTGTPNNSMKENQNLSIDSENDLQSVSRLSMDDTENQFAPYHVVCGARQIPKQRETMVLVPRKIIKPESSESGLRRSNRNRMQPVRQWLGEKPVYVDSPSGGKRLVGTTKVEVKDNRFLKVRSADPLVVMHREQQTTSRKRIEREKRKEAALLRKMVRVKELKARHYRGIDLDVTVDSIVTSSDEDDCS